MQLSNGASGSNGQTRVNVMTGNLILSLTRPLWHRVCISFIFSKANRDIIQFKLQLNVLHISVVNHIFVQNEVSIIVITPVPCTANAYGWYLVRFTILPSYFLGNQTRMACSAVHYIGALGGKECTVDVDILVPLHLMLTY